MARPAFSADRRRRRPFGPAPRIVLVGPPAAGKTTIGRLLGERYGVPMIDTDLVLAERHGPIGELFAERGEDEFRALERAVVAEAVTALAARPGIVSLGGGAVLSAETRALLRERDVVVVLLTIDAAVAARRINNGKRPLLLSGSQTPIERWSSLVAARLPLYREVADVVVQAGPQHPAVLARRIMSAVLTHDATRRLRDVARASERPHPHPAPAPAAGPPTERQNRP